MQQFKNDRFISIMSVAIVLAIVILAISGCADDPEHAWFRGQEHRCWTMGGRGWYSRETQIYECNRHTFWQNNVKLLFREKYVAAVVPQLIEKSQ